MRRTLRLLSMIALLAFAPIAAFAQLGSIVGTVTDSNTGEVLPTANVFLVEISRGATTDFDGAYAIENVPAGVYTVRVTYVGYKQYTTSLEVGSSRVNLDVQLKADLVGLEELVVTGYGTQIKEKQTGNVASISGEAIQNSPVPTFEQALQGQLAGVNITAGNGKVGQGLQIRIRGAASVSASNEPLYVIDGVPVISSGDGIGPDQNPLAEINFNDIESINVLKDASAAAIYGSRASNGVIVITTKRGKSGKTNINVNFSQGFSGRTDDRDFLNARDYVNGFLRSAINLDLIDGLADSTNYFSPGQRSVTQVDPLNLPNEIDFFNQGFTWVGWIKNRFDSRYTRGTDWRNFEVDEDWGDEAFQDATQTNFDISASGGDDKTRFFVSGGIANQDGVLIDNKQLRYSGRLNVDHNVSDKLDVGMNLSLSRTETDRLSSDNSFATPLQLVAQPPIQPIIDPTTGGVNGNADLSFSDRNTATLYFNGLLNREGAEFTSVVFRSVGRAYADYEFIPGLSLRGEFGVDIRTQNENRWFGTSIVRNTGLFQGGGRSRWVQNVNYNTKALLTYQTTINTVHNVEAVSGIEFNQVKSNRTDVSAQDFPTNSFKTLAAASTVTNGTSDLTFSNFLSYFVRGNYDYNGKYLFQASARVDGSSRFGSDNQYGFFPSVSGGWILSRESFLEDNETISFLKLRASWGQTGNAGIGNFPSRGLFGGVAFNGQPGLAPTQAPNPELKWETTTQINFGVDFGVLNDRITGEIDYYIKDTEDLLLNQNVPATTGFTSIVDNIGDMENKGLEILINTYNFVGEFSWRTSFNFARNINKVTNLDGQIIEGGDFNRAQEGSPVGVFFGAEFAGADPRNGDALWFWNNDAWDGNAGSLPNGVFLLDRFGNKPVTNNFGAANRIVLGDPNPDFIGGLTNQFSYKGFDLNILLQYQYGNDIHNAAGNFMSASFDFFDNQTTDQLDFWTPDNPNTDVPEARFISGNGTQLSSRWLEDGSFIRLKTVTLAYSLPRSILSQVGMNSLRVYATGQNLITWTSYSGWDPEVNTDFLASNIGLGNDFYAAPQARTILFGINLGF